MSDIKNPFSFGTGNIDKDLWLRDIDNEQEDFITRYGSATNKHRTALLRQAFQDLRGRIASGDMLNRTADGLYQFGSALNRDDKHMQEAYQRALGFMGDLARRQIQAPPTAPEKKAIGSLEERYIKSLNPSGKFNTEAYWKNQTDEERRTALKDFLNRELKDADNYQDFGNFGNKDTYTRRLQTVMNLLESGKANDWSLQRLGFTKNWLTQPTLEEPEEKKSELEQVLSDIAAAQEAQQVQQGRQYLAFNSNRGQQEFNFTTPQFDLNYQLQHLLTTPQEMGGGTGFAPSGPSSDVLRRAATSKYINDLQNLLDLYFKNFATSWRPNYESGEANQKVMQDFLSKLFSTYSKGTNADGTPASDYAFDWKKYFTLIGQNQFLINGSIDNQTGRYAYYVPGEGIREDNILDNPNQFVALKLGYTIPSLKEGGKVEFLESGGGFDYDAWVTSQETPKTQVISKPQQTTAPKLEGSSFSTAENARIAATIADIASMGVAFVPGYGTAASAVLGLGSTATNFGADLADGQGLWNATKNAGFGLAADVMGLIPGLGGAGKGAKIARNLMWAVPKMMLWVNTYQGLLNAEEIKNSIMKLTSPSSMTVQDWLNISQALQIMTGHGRSVVSKVKNSAMKKTTTSTTNPEYYVFTNKGKLKISDETFKKLREVKGTKERQALTEQLMGEGVTLLQTRFAPWNTSTRFGAFKEVPSKTSIKVDGTKTGWKGYFRDENIHQAVINHDGEGLDIRSIIYKINPYKSYYLKVKLNSPSEAAKLTSSTQPSEQVVLTATTKPTRKLTEELKKARALKRSQKKQEAEAKLRLLRELQAKTQQFAILEEIPMASSQAAARAQAQNHMNLSLKYANIGENPGPKPINPQVESFNNRYGRAIRKKQTGGILKALRNGGIIKALLGLSSKYSIGDLDESNPMGSWGNLNWGTTLNSSFKDYLTAGYNRRNGITWSRGLWGTADSDLDMFSAYNAQRNYYTQNEGNNIMGDVKNYFSLWIKENEGKNVNDFILDYNSKVDRLRELNKIKIGTPANTKGPEWDEFNSLHHKIYPSYGLLSDGRDDWSDKLKDILGESTWRRIPNSFNGLSDLLDKRSAFLMGEDPKWQVAMDNEGHLITGATINPDNDIDEHSSTSNDSIADSEGERGTPMELKLKDPFDPTLATVAAKTLLGLRGNRDIYGNLLKEMPQAPLRDPIDRKLAIVGWQEAIKQGQNQLADLRRVQQIQRGSDQQTNFATALETERTGRDIMDKTFMLDSGRLFETALKSWNLDNEDTLYNAGVGDANRRSIADRARMMAQIRAAWRSGNNNILMGGLADAGNWLLKRYQREQDVVDRARGIELGTPESRMQERLITELGNLANKKPSEMTAAEIAKVEATKAKILRQSNKTYASDYYNMFHIPGFGGGYYTTIAKDGTKLEVAKLKARGKDNDRYVSMIKDLRQSSRRRRRR